MEPGESRKSGSDQIDQSGHCRFCQWGDQPSICPVRHGDHIGEVHEQKFLQNSIADRCQLPGLCHLQRYLPLSRIALYTESTVGLDEAGKAAMYAYGKHLGLAFQVVDDILDFTQSTEILGKPQALSLSSKLRLSSPLLCCVYRVKIWRVEI